MRRYLESEQYKYFSKISFEKRIKEISCNIRDPSEIIQPRSFIGGHSEEIIYKIVEIRKLARYFSKNDFTIKDLELENAVDYVWAKIMIELTEQNGIILGDKCPEETDYHDPVFLKNIFEFFGGMTLPELKSFQDRLKKDIENQLNSNRDDSV